MERKTRKKLVEVTEEYFVAIDGTEHDTEEQCRYHEKNCNEVENRSQRIQIVIKPSVNKELDRLVKQEKIKSKNDLVNFLLESFIEQNK